MMDTSIIPESVSGRPEPRQSRPKVGVALSGGILKGVAHIGVLQVLAEAHIPIDFIAGTSIGSIIGAYYASGKDIEEMINLANTFRWNRILGLGRKLSGLFDMLRLEQYLENEIGLKHFAQLKIPFACVATDLQSGEAVIFRDGPLGIALRASCSLPGLVSPVHWEDRLLVDGFAVNNLPVSVCREMGADYVIGIDLVTLLGAKLPSNPLEVWGATFSILIRNNAVFQSPADCLIQPAVGEFSWFWISDAKALIEAGRTAALAKLPQICAELSLPFPDPVLLR